MKSILDIRGRGHGLFHALFILGEWECGSLLLASYGEQRFHFPPEEKNGRQEKKFEKV